MGIASLRKPLLPSELVPTDRQLIMDVGRVMYDATALRTTEAGAEFKILVDKYPETPNIHYLYGSFLMFADANNGLREMKKELEVSPAHVPAMVTIANEYIQRKDFQSALPYAQKATELEPQSFPAHAVLGRVFAEGDLDVPARHPGTGGGPQAGARKPAGADCAGDRLRQGRPQGGCSPRAPGIPEAAPGSGCRGGRTVRDETSGVRVGFSAWQALRALCARAGPDTDGRSLGAANRRLRVFRANVRDCVKCHAGRSQGAPAHPHGARCRDQRGMQCVEEPPPHEDAAGALRLPNRAPGRPRVSILSRMAWRP